MSDYPKTEVEALEGELCDFESRVMFLLDKLQQADFMRTTAENETEEVARKLSRAVGALGEILGLVGGLAQTDPKLHTSIVAASAKGGVLKPDSGAR